LVDNAVKFTERGEVVLRVAAPAPRDGHIPLRLSVRDSGSGIPEAQRSLIFQHFTPADSSTTRKHGGTGPGLAICRQLVELMRGRRIELENELGRAAPSRSIWSFRLAGEAAAASLLLPVPREVA
jgi:two-component system sensor histidine kinase/response regulator